MMLLSFMHPGYSWMIMVWRYPGCDAPWGIHATRSIVSKIWLAEAGPQTRGAAVRSLLRWDLPHIGRADQCNSLAGILGWKFWWVQEPVNQLEIWRVFFLSHDRKFLIKTVSEAEGRLLFRMLPEYQDHIHSLPASLIVRFAGLYHVEVGSGSWKYFLVMILVQQSSFVIFVVQFSQGYHGSQ